MHAYLYSGTNLKSTQDIKKAIGQYIHHVLSVAIVMRTARVSITIIFAVNYSALHSLLNLMDTQKIGKIVNNIPAHLIKKKTNNKINFHFYLYSFSVHLVVLPSYLSAQDAVDHDNNETLQRVENGKEDLEKGGATVSDG